METPKATVGLTENNRNKFYHKHNSQFNINLKKCLHSMVRNKRTGHPKLTVILLMPYAYLMLESFESQTQSFPFIFSIKYMTWGI